MTLPDDLLTTLRAALEQSVRIDNTRRASSKGHLSDDAFSSIELTVGDVRRLHAALCAETSDE